MELRTIYWNFLCLSWIDPIMNIFWELYEIFGLEKKKLISK
jgi:hypothetical protein